MIHLRHPSLTQAFSVALVGVGGNGSQMLTCLARLHHSLTALGHPGFHVTAYDPDTVSDANIGRQMFAPADVGHNKAEILVYRVNAHFGLNWSAAPRRVDKCERTLVISCVDSPASRVQVQMLARGIYLLDLGNRAADGQALLGQIGGATKKPLPGHVDLPHPYTILPELIDTAAPADDTPSCSLAEALERQELFINDDVTRAASLVLWNLLRHGQISWHGAFVNAAAGRRSPIAVDPEVWKRMSATGQDAGFRRKGK